MSTIALYARVSTEKQIHSDTIASQIIAIENKIKEDGYILLDEYKFIDNGFSGANLQRPALERLRDKVYGGEIDKIYIHSPDRLSRKYAYQMILLEEFQKSGIEVIFLNNQINDTPESHLLLQMQGMIAEYERAKITERHRRGRIHAAKKGSVNALSGAPYGYHYIPKHIGGGQASYEINEEEAEIVRKMFYWVGHERLTLGEVWRRINKLCPITRKGKTFWNRATIWKILKNPAYKGQAAFGKRKSGAVAPRIRPQKRSSEHPKWNYSLYNTEKEDWIYIPVPAIIDENLFDVVQEQMEENKKLARVRRENARNLLQGLAVCQICKRAYYASKKGKKPGNIKGDYTYYRCSGTNRERFGNDFKICDNKPIRTEVLETAVWEEVQSLLKNPQRLSEEYQRRINELKKSPLDDTIESLNKQEKRLNLGSSRLIDSYAMGQIDKEEFEPRIKMIKNSLKALEKQKASLTSQNNLKKELQLIVTSIEKFRLSIESSLEAIDWHVKQDIIRMVVKRVEINYNEINVVFRVPEASSPGIELGGQQNQQHCCRGIH